MDCERSLGFLRAPEMEALLHDRRAPLFGRTTFELTLGPWNLTTIFEVCRDLVDFQRLLSDELNGQPGTLPVSPKLNGTE